MEGEPGSSSFALGYKWAFKCGRIGAEYYIFKENETMKIAFGTVIYKQAKSYFNDLMNSVSKQTAGDFDVIIVNDNYSKDELSDLTIKADLFLDLEPKHCTVAQTRIEMIRAAKEAGYELLVVSDADDTFADTRLEEYKKAYELDKSYAFYYNELVTDDGRTVLEDMPEEVTSVRAISQSNFIGMGTTAINLTMISENFLESLSEGDCPVFDWYFFSRVLMDVGPGKLVRNAATIYRIHDNNVVGTSHNVDQEYQVKLTHYQNLAKRYPYFKHLYDDLKALDISKIDASQSHKGYWWSNIIMEDSYEI